MRNRVKDPPERSGVRIVGSDVTGRRRETLADRATNDVEVLEDHARCARTDRHAFDGPIETFAQIHAPAFAERLDRLSGAFVQRPEIVAMCDEYPIAIHGHAAMAIATRPV